MNRSLTVVFSSVSIFSPLWLLGCGTQPVAKNPPAPVVAPGVPSANTPVPGQQVPSQPVPGQPPTGGAPPIAPPAATDPIKVTAEELASAAAKDPENLPQQFLNRLLIVDGYAWEVDSLAAYKNFYLQGADGVIVRIDIAATETPRRVQPGQRVTISGKLNSLSRVPSIFISDAKLESQSNYSRPEKPLAWFQSFTTDDLLAEADKEALAGKLLVLNKDGVTITKRVIVEGTVGEIQPAMGVLPMTIFLAGKESPRQISCNFGDQDDAMKIKEGQTITIVGTYVLSTKKSESLPASVHLKDCYQY